MAKGAKSFAVPVGRLSKADKELIIVATSVVNRCPYCVVAHGALHRIYSKQPALADQVSGVTTPCAPPLPHDPLEEGNGPLMCLLSHLKF